MKRQWWLLVLLGLFPCLGRAQVQLDSFARGVMDSFTADSTEHVVCFGGTVTDDAISLYNPYVPEQHPFVQSMPNGTTQPGTSVDMGICSRAIAIWHNHPVPRDSIPSTYLFFTLTDQRTFLDETSALVAMVGVRDGSWCWWSRAQVVVASRDHRNIAPIKGQCEGVTGPLYGRFL